MYIDDLSKGWRGALRARAISPELTLLPFFELFLATQYHLFYKVPTLNYNSPSETLPYFCTRSPAIAEGPRDAGVPVEIW